MTCTYSDTLHNTQYHVYLVLPYTAHTFMYTFWHPIIHTMSCTSSVTLHTTQYHVRILTSYIYHRKICSKLLSKCAKTLPNLLLVTECCSVLQCVAVCCSVLQCVAVCCVCVCVRVWAREKKCVYKSACKGVLQCVALCCSVLQCVYESACERVLQCATVCCSVLQRVAVCVRECV